MIDDNKIKEIAYEYNDGESVDDKLIRCAFINGAKWMRGELSSADKE